MSVTITCPKCRAGLKANRLPPANQSIQCVRCKHRFAPSAGSIHETAISGNTVPADGVQAGKSPKAKSVAAKSKAGPKITAPINSPVKRPAASGLRWHHAAIAAVVGLVLVGGVAGSWWLAQPQAETSVAQSKTSESTPPKAAPKAEPKPEPKPEPVAKADPDREKRQEKFISLMFAGGKAQQLKKWDDALAAYADAQKIYPDNAELQKNLEDVKTAKSEAQKAAADAEALKAEVVKLTGEAKRFLELNQPTEAKKLLDVALSKLPEDPDATKFLADAKASIDAADPKKIGEKFDTHILAGKAALKANQPADAIREFLAAKELMPNDPLPPDLIREAEKALVLAKNEKPAVKKSDFQLLLEKAKELTNDKKYKAAEGAYQQALQLQPGDADATAGLAAVQALMTAGQGDAKKLQAQADQALRNKQVSDAINLYQQALAADPNNADLQRMLQLARLIQVNQAAYYQAVASGTQAMIDRRYGDAVIAFQAALSIAPGDPYVSGNLLQAQNAVIALAQMQQNYQNLTAQASAALRAQQYSRALALLQQAAASIRPPLTVDATTQAMANYADAMAKATSAMNSNRFQEAINWFQAALRASPGDNFANFGLQQAQQKLRNQPRPK
jgi:tetratricopeptide (TPR) repeat protein